MKKMFFFVIFALSSVSYAADYSCSYHSKKGQDPGYKGQLSVSLNDDGSIVVTGDYTSFDSGNTYSEPHVDCAGHRDTETKAGYFKKWASYGLTYTADKRPNCQESSIRVSKDENGNPDMRAVVLINYRGDTHDYSGFQSFFFVCEAL